MEEPGQVKRALMDSTAGAIAGAVSRNVTSPLDVIKIRFQVQLEPTSASALLGSNLPARSKYKGIFQATKDIYREEGLPITGAGHGHSPETVLPATEPALMTKK